MILSFQHIGKRKRQEDAFYINEDIGLYVICDGVGGHENGDQASKQVIASIAHYFDNNSIKPICPNCIVNAIRFAQSELNKSQQERETFTQLGTTIALLYYKQEKAITAHMGDSRIMLVKNKASEAWTTKDHSLVQELYDANILKTEEELLNHPMKNRITNAIYAGQSEDNLKITTHDLVNIVKKDKFILFTDGLLDAFTPKEIVSTLNNNNLERSMAIFSQKVKEDSSDNSTLILLEI